MHCILTTYYLLLLLFVIWARCDERHGGGGEEKGPQVAPSDAEAMLQKAALKAQAKVTPLRALFWGGGRGGTGRG
eukprot:scaffold263758_cov36-Tisochrysis_lutea.AAC.1